MEADEQHVQISLTTQLPPPLVASDLPLAVPARLTRLGLSEVVNHLLELDEPHAFDFLIDGELLRSSLEEHVRGKGLSLEEVVVVEYFLVPKRPEHAEDKPHEDWVAGIAIGSSFSVLTASYDKTGRIWEQEADGHAVTTLLGHEDSATCCTWVEEEGETGRFAITGGKDFSLLAYSVAKGKHGGQSVQPCFRLRGHEGAVQAVACRGPLLCSASWDKTIKIWPVPRCKELEGLEEQEAITQSSKRSKVEEGKKAASTKDRGCLSTLVGHTQAVTGLDVGEKGEIVSGGWDHTVKSWDAETQQCTTNLSSNSAVNGVAVSLSGLFASAHADRAVRVWDPRAGALVRKSLASHKGWVNAGKVPASPLSLLPPLLPFLAMLGVISFEPRLSIRALIVPGPKMKLSLRGGLNNLVWLKQLLRPLWPSDHQSQINFLLLLLLLLLFLYRPSLVQLTGSDAVSWSPSSEHHLVSSSHDHTIKLWDFRSSIPLHTIAAHEGKALCVSWGKDGFIYSGGSDCKVSRYSCPATLP
eukprot:768143-Hanusia_phi.AAC.7